MGIQRKQEPLSNLICKMKQYCLLISTQLWKTLNSDIAKDRNLEKVYAIQTVCKATGEAMYMSHLSCKQPLSKHSQTEQRKEKEKWKSLPISHRTKHVLQTRQWTCKMRRYTVWKLLGKHHTSKPDHTAQHTAPGPENSARQASQAS